jgi:hypothetical protein
MAEPDVGRLDEAAVEELLNRFDELVDRVEQVPGPSAEAAVEAIQVLAEVYGEALARVAGLGGPQLVARLTEDELLSHLLGLHGLHPKPVDERVTDVLAEVGSQLGDKADVELTGIDAGVARIRVTAAGCGSGDIADSVSEVVLSVAPELSRVDPETVPPAAAAPLFPVESLLRRPGGAP